VRYAFIEQQRERFEVKIMCRMLAVSVSGYYAWKRRPESRQAWANRVLSQRIRAIHDTSRGTYGVRRVQAALRHEQVGCGKQRVARLMRSAGLQGKGRVRRRPRTTVAYPSRPVAPNVLNREFSATAPNQKWVADITYIDTQQGYNYRRGLALGTSGT
jgi:transposase InsO family protein